MTNLSNALIADMAAIIGEHHTHVKIDIMFGGLGLPVDGFVGNKVLKVQELLQRANRDPAFDAVSVLGRVLEEFMDREVLVDRERTEGARADVVRALARHGLSYRHGGTIIGATLSTPSRSLEDRIRERNLGELQKEFDRALANVESDPPAAITAACAILEVLFKVIIADEGLTLPSDQSVLPLWREVQTHLGLKPGSISDQHVRQIVQGLSSSIQGIAGLRSNVGSAHGQGPGAPRVEPRHARLAVHAAHTVVVFLLESME
jgi:hypothetical protein